MLDFETLKTAFISGVTRTVIAGNTVGIYENAKTKEIKIDDSFVLPVGIGLKRALEKFTNAENKEILNEFLEKTKHIPKQTTYNNWLENIGDNEIANFLVKFFELHGTTLRQGFNFLVESIKENPEIKPLLTYHTIKEPHITSSLREISDNLGIAIQLGYPDKDEEKDKCRAIELDFSYHFATRELTKDLLERQALPEFVITQKFLSYVFRETKEESYKQKLKEKDKQIQESENKLLAIIKTPVNLLNVLLTDKVKTLEKLDKSINKITNAIEKSTDNKKKSQLQRQLKEAKRVFDKCVNNFPDNFNFSVYEHYAIFGGFKLLTQNQYKPTEIFFIDILKSLNFKNKNRSEISLIKQAFVKLTTQKFPCYMIRQSDSGEDKYDFYDGDEPIFKIREFGTLDLNIDLTDKEIVKKKLILSLENPALIYDLQNFYMLINGNILSELREYKKVSEADLYFVEYLVKEKHFKRKQTETTLNKLCEVMKKSNFLDKNKDIKDRDSKRRIKAIVLNLSSFMQKQNILSSYEIADSGDVVFKYPTDNEKETLGLPVAVSVG